MEPKKTPKCSIKKQQQTEGIMVHNLKSAVIKTAWPGMNIDPWSKIIVKGTETNYTFTVNWILTK